MFNNNQKKRIATAFALLPKVFNLKADSNPPFETLLNQFEKMVAQSLSNQKIVKAFTEPELIEIGNLLGCNFTSKGSKNQKVISIKKKLLQEPVLS